MLLHYQKITIMKFLTHPSRIFHAYKHWKYIF
jgi:hypothetical protein